MTVPKPRRLSSGNYFIQMRLGGESVSVTAPTSKECTREASYIKAEYLAGKRAPKQEPVEEVKLPTLSSLIDQYINSKSNTLSPSTVRGYRAIQKNRFKATMERSVSDITEDEWQSITNKEAALCSPKTLKNSFAFIRTVLQSEAKIKIPEVTLPGSVSNETAFLTPDEIKLFVEAVKDTKYAIPTLLALSSLRISEIYALQWENIAKNPKFVRVAGAVVLDEDHRFTKKKQNKNSSSTRNVPIFIPELAAAIERDRQPSGRVVTMKQNTLRLGIHKICKEAGITDVTVHGLRHSFASLAYHLRIPERIAMEIGGWANINTMQKVYTHIAKSDISRYQTELQNFYSGRKSANKNANEPENY